MNVFILTLSTALWLPYIAPGDYVLVNEISTCYVSFIARGNSPPWIL